MGLSLAYSLAVKDDVISSALRVALVQRTRKLRSEIKLLCKDLENLQALAVGPPVNPVGESEVVLRAKQRVSRIKSALGSSN